MECSRCAWALVYRSRLTTPVLFLWRKPVGSLKFPGNPFMLLPCSQTPVGSSRLAHLRRFDSAPAVRTTKAPTLTHYFEAQSHGFSTRSIRFVPTSLPTTQCSLPAGWPAFAGWGSFPTRSLYCVSKACFLSDYMLFLTFWVCLTRPDGRFPEEASATESRVRALATDR